ncbi:MAG TPA: hypothetical protein VKQ36_08930 [Ktedonobacterales bacterium]|nr:hypothetical protein [Ktedonobacterales bacterium]
MARRVLGGVVAWLVSVIPLAIVNGIAALGSLSVDAAALLGAVALIMGVALGALTAGIIGGRAPDLDAEEGQQARMGARGALWSGGIAGTLYALAMGGLLLLAAQANALPNIVLLHPLRISLAIICIATVIMAGSMLVGWYVARGMTVDDLESASKAALSARVGQPSQRLASASTSHATQRPIPSAPLRPPAPSRPLGQPRWEGSANPDTYTRPTRPTMPRNPATQNVSDNWGTRSPRPASSSAPRDHSDRAGWDHTRLPDLEGLPDLRGPHGDDRYGEWDEPSAIRPPARGDRR